MTVTTTLDRQYFDGDGSNKNFPFNFRFFSNSDIYVFLLDASGNEIGQTLNVDYTMSGAGAAAGGQIVFSVAPPVGVKNVLIQRILAQVQPTSIRNQGAFFPAIHEDVFDRLTMLIQQAITGSSRSLQLDRSGLRWDFKGFKGINAGAPTDPNDVATLGWAQNYVSSIIATGQGPINNAANVIYAPSGGGASTTVAAALDALAARLPQIQSVTSLRAMTTGQDVYLVDYNGGFNVRSNPVPRGGGRLYWISSSTAADNGITIFKATSIATGRFFRELPNDEMTPDMAGCLGDGVTNDFAKFQAALTLCENSNKVLVIPPRDYLCQGTLVQTKRMTIRGSGSGLSRILYQGTGAGLRWDAPFAGASNTRYNWLNFGIICAAGTGTYGLHLKLQAATSPAVSFLADSNIHDVACLGFASAGLHLDNSVSNVDGFFSVSITRCEMENGILLNKIGDTMRVSGNKTYGRNCGILWYGVPGARGSELEWNSITTSDGAIGFLGAQGVRVANNQCEHPGYIRGYGGAFDCAIYIHDCLLIHFEDNTVNPDNGAATAPVAPGIATSAIVLDGTSTAITFGRNNAVQQGSVAHFNIGQSSVTDTRIDESNRAYTGALIINDSGTRSILPTLRGAAAYSATIGAGVATGSTVPVATARLGSYVEISYSNGSQGLDLRGWVSSTGTVSVRLFNDTGAAVTLTGGNLTAKVSR